MFISREFDYALRIMRALSKNERLNVKQICAVEHVPQPYTYKILKKLEKKSYVRSYRGKHGGYELIVDLRLVTMYDMYMAIEGDLYINECMRDDYVCPSRAAGKNCSIHNELLKMQKRLIDDMCNRTLLDVFEME